MLQAITRPSSVSFSRIALLVSAAFLGSSALVEAQVVRICASTPDLGSIAKTIGGDEVEVTTLVKGPQDPHNVTAKPSFIKALHRTDILLFTGLDLELAWLPTLVGTARNRKIYSGGSGFLDASTVIKPMNVPKGLVDRSSGDVHALGNPHYLLDPINGMRVAALVQRKLGQLRPGRKTVFAANMSRFSEAVMSRFFGEKVVTQRGAKVTAKWTETLVGKGLRACVAEIESDGDRELLGGWLGQLAGREEIRAVADHQTWNYFAARFGVKIVGYMEPKPGITPTSRHLARLVKSMEEQKVSVLISSPYFDPRSVDFVKRHSTARAAPLAHQAGARPGTDDYLAMIDYNIAQIVAASETGDRS